MKALGLGRLVKFDFFDSPPVETLMRAYEQLIMLEAIEETGEISALGKVMSLLSLTQASLFLCLTVRILTM